MLASLGDSPFDNPEWLFETKYDGYRALALCDGKGKVQLYSRNLLSFNQMYAPLVQQLSKIKHACLLDGEIVVEDTKGRSSFQLLQNYENEPWRLKYYVFDLLMLDKKLTIDLPLLERKDLLELLLGKFKLSNVFYSAHVIAKGKQLFKRAKQKGWEGIIAKHGYSAYRPGKRTTDWLKIKLTQEQEAVIIGITPPKGSRAFFGALLLGAYVKGKLQFTGKCGTGFTDKDLEQLYQKFKPLFTEKVPVTQPAGINQIQWLKPKLVCQVKFTEWTTDGSMRHPVFMGLRLD